jgi:hypothetical protein
MSVPEFTPRARMATRVFVLGVIGAAAFCVTMAIHAAHAEGYIVSCDMSVGVTCFAGPMHDPYVRQVPQPTSEDEKAAARARDEQWVKDCAPTLVRDRYGVSRYHYNDPGCVFGSHP